MTQGNSGELSPIEKLDEMSESLSQAIRQGDESAVKRVRKFFDNLTDSDLAAKTDEYAAATVMRECGLRDREMAVALFEGRLQPGDDAGTFWHDGYTDIFLNNWCVQYEQARVALAKDGGYLLPYKEQFVVVQRGFIKLLGLDANDPAWESIGYDAVRPRDSAAYRRLAVARLEKFRRDSLEHEQG
ncbi:MAG TPA: hypothetical protein VF543_03700 [Pyrinomonadaceae bacterium]|jgi:hypothetical protein